jgi:hypothetical protein
MAVVLVEGVPDNCLGSTLVRVYCGWSTYIVLSLIEGTYFLIPKGGLPKKARCLYYLLPLLGLNTSVYFSLLLFHAVGSLLLFYGMPLKL